MISEHPRRCFVYWTIAAPLVFCASASGAQQQNGNPNRSAPAHTGSGPAPPSGIHGSNDSLNASTGGPAAPDPDPKEVLKANDKDMKSNVSRLAELAEDLKKQVDATDSTSVLSLTMVHKAEEIEKLAHHIATLARG